MSLRTRLERLESLVIDEPTGPWDTVVTYPDGTAHLGPKVYATLAEAKAATPNNVMIIEVYDASRPRPGEVTA